VNYFLVKEAFIVKQKKILNTLVNDFSFSCFSFLFLQFFFSFLFLQKRKEKYITK
jgi:hypothetical protein